MVALQNESTAQIKSTTPDPMRALPIRRLPNEIKLRELHSAVLIKREL